MNHSAYANCERQTEGNTAEYLCDVCFKWHRDSNRDYGFSFNFGIPNNFRGMKIKLCPKCATVIASLLVKAWDGIDAGIQMQRKAKRNEAD